MGVKDHIMPSDSSGTAKLRDDYAKLAAGEDIGIPDLTDGGRCTGCGKCCGATLAMHPGEIAAIRDYIAAHGIRPEMHEARYVRQIGIPEGESFLMADMACPFLCDAPGEDRCLIRPVRPAACKAYLCRDVARGRNAELYRRMSAYVTPEQAAEMRGRPEINLRQEFFPDVFEPEPGDLCFVSGRDKALFAEHGAKPCVVLSAEARGGARIARAAVLSGPGMRPEAVLETDIRNIDKLTRRDAGWKMSDLDGKGDG